MGRGRAGFTLAELLMAMAIVLTLAVVASPYCADYLRSAEKRRAARELAQSLRHARSLAIRDNAEYKVAFDLDSASYWLQRDGVRLRDLGRFGDHLRMASGAACVDIEGDGNTAHPEYTVEFNPNGSSQSHYTCVLDAAGRAWYRVGVTHAATGRVKTQYWNDGTGLWH